MYLIDEGHQKRVGNEARYILGRRDFYGSVGQVRGRMDVDSGTKSYPFHMQQRKRVHDQAFQESFEELKLAQPISTTRSGLQSRARLY